MKNVIIYPIAVLVGCGFILTARVLKDTLWLRETRKKYRLYYQKVDLKNKDAYQAFFRKGMKSVEDFFHTPFKSRFSIYVHPHRKSLDSTWQKDWKMPGFKSQCGMVANGVGHKLDIISPKRWDKLACEHTYAQTTNTQRLISHELFHVFHGQLNKSPDFRNVQGIDWFIEGFATYAAGQCDQERIAQVKRVIAQDKVPKAGLSKFWTGEARYGLSGLVVKYLDKKYGRNKLKELLKCRTKQEILAQLKITESQLLQEWQRFVKGL